MVVAVLAVIGWIALDRVIGLAMAVVMLAMLIVAEWIARSYGSSTAWIVFAVFFVGGWVFQLVGHVWEGRRPALADNLFQAFIGPMFIMAEVLIALGLKPELKAAIEHAPRARAELQRPALSPAGISLVPSASASRCVAAPGLSGCCWLSCGAQPDSQTISNVARRRPSASAKRSA